MQQERADESGDEELSPSAKASKDFAASLDDSDEVRSHSPSTYQQLSCMNSTTSNECLSSARRLIILSHAPPSYSFPHSLA
jgi:hypothetical protein